MLRRWQSIGGRRLLIAAALLPSLAVLLFGLDLPHLGFYKDDGVYLATAYSLAKGEGYRTASLPGAPWQVKYPPLYPAMLSAAFWTGEAATRGLALAGALNWLALPLFAWLALRLFERSRFSAPGLAVLLCLAYSGTADAAHSLLSDMWMAVAVLAALLAVERSPAAAALLASAAFLTRTAAVTLIAAVVVEYALRRRWRDAAVFAVIVTVPAAAWTAWSSAHRPQLHDYNDTYMSTYADIFAYESPWRVVLERLPGQAAAVLTETGRMLMPDWLGGSELNWIRAGLGVLTVASVLALPRIYRMYVGASLALLILWPWNPFPRFFVPVLPFAAAGVCCVLARLGGRYRISVPAGLVAFWLALMLVAGEAQQAYLIHAYRGRNAGLAPVYDWIRDHTPPDAAFAAFRDARLFLLTGRRAECLYFSARDELDSPGASVARLMSLPEWSRRRGLRFAVLAPGDYGMSEAEWEQLKAKLHHEAAPVFQFQGVIVFDFHPPAGYR